MRIKNQICIDIYVFSLIVFIFYCVNFFYFANYNVKKFLKNIRVLQRYYNILKILRSVIIKYSSVIIKKFLVTKEYRFIKLAVLKTRLKSQITYLLYLQI